MDRIYQLAVRTLKASLRERVFRAKFRKEPEARWYELAEFEKARFLDMKMELSALTGGKSIDPSSYDQAYGDAALEVLESLVSQGIPDAGTLLGELQPRERLL